ncbi:hypothetical protein H2198_001826 [Neophaeococcomyces mojaviensis]|uniref:Uncharacterized protein n=1 Tax=Neophaeococcomyces mojaviensis TaxID=3383035 RepID=A0ACC3AFU8_9EURO|nr:hypothetical protein H2198_001826 [Knufia sp. JES_112]
MPAFTPVNLQRRMQQSDRKQCYWFGPDEPSNHAPIATPLLGKVDGSQLFKPKDQTVVNANSTDLVKLLRPLNDRLSEIEKIYQSKTWPSTKPQELKAQGVAYRQPCTDELYKRLAVAPKHTRSTTLERRDSGIGLDADDNQKLPSEILSPASKIILTSDIVPILEDGYLIQDVAQKPKMPASYMTPPAEFPDQYSRSPALSGNRKRCRSTCQGPSRASETHHGQKQPRLHGRFVKSCAAPAKTSAPSHSYYTRARARANIIFQNSCISKNEAQIPPKCRTVVDPTSCIPYKEKRSKFSENITNRASDDNQKSIPADHDSGQGIVQDSLNNGTFWSSTQFDPMSQNHYDVPEATYDILPAPSTSEIASDAASDSCADPGLSPHSIDQDNTTADHEITFSWSSNSSVSALLPATPPCSSGLQLLDELVQADDSTAAMLCESDAVVATADQLSAIRQPCHDIRATQPQSKTVKTNKEAIAQNHEDRTPYSTRQTQSESQAQPQPKPEPLSSTKPIQAKPHPKPCPINNPDPIHNPTPASEIPTTVDSRDPIEPTFVSAAIARAAQRFAAPRSQARAQKRSATTIWHAIGTKGEVEWRGQTRVIGAIMRARFSGCD